MSSEQLLLVMTTVLAAVALVAAFVAVRTVRRMDASPTDTPTPAPAVPGGAGPVRSEQVKPEAELPVPIVVEGRVIVPPTSRQVVDATLGRPLVRLSVVSHGLAHALRPESRDRIVALMRREFQSRRRQRKRAARQAARQDFPQRAIDRRSITTEAWLGELPQPKPAAAPNHRAVES